MVTSSLPLRLDHCPSIVSALAVLPRACLTGSDQWTLATEYHDVTCTRRLSQTPLRLQSPHRHYIKASQPIVPAPLPRAIIHRGSSAIVSATPSSLSDTQGTRFHLEMNALIEEELRGATYHVDLTAEDGILRADPGIVESVNNSLQATFQALTSGGRSSVTKPRLPTDRFSNEARSYGPLVHLLNKIINTATKHVPQSQLSKLQFHTFGGEVKETYGSHKGLKPDGIGTIGKLPTKTKKSSILTKTLLKSFKNRSHLTYLVDRLNFLSNRSPQ